MIQLVQTTNDVAEETNEVVEKGNDLLTITKGGKSLEVTRKAFNVHYAGLGYKVDGEKAAPKVYTLDELKELSDKELKKVTNEQYKEVLDAEGVDYEENATKADFISFVKGE